MFLYLCIKCCLLISKIFFVIFRLILAFTSVMDVLQKILQIRNICLCFRHILCRIFVSNNFAIFCLLLASTSVMEVCTENFTNQDIFFIFLTHLTFQSFCLKCCLFILKIFLTKCGN